MSYKITEYTKHKAKELGVIVKPSQVKNKKIDVFDKEGDKLASVGAIGYDDFPTCIRKKGRVYAEQRRKLYKERHEKDRHEKGTPGYWADRLLW